jgi:hypothetical protein
MEGVMQLLRTDVTESSRLRVVFDEAVVSLELAAQATFEDVARTLGELEPQRYGSPISIAVTLADRPGH